MTASQHSFPAGKASPPVDAILRQVGFVMFAFIRRKAALHNSFLPLSSVESHQTALHNILSPCLPQQHRGFAPSTAHSCVSYRPDRFSPRRRRRSTSVSASTSDPKKPQNRPSRKQSNTWPTSVRRGHTSHCWRDTTLAWEWTRRSECA